ncbi:hypothetical protein [Adlercreutzia murintestinalis]|uniref:hypothetical protein n=1 Tax=Adlercreutzia murintestinalis TaxID=2941325 RepID=UPI00203C00F0|nr:hypothetical protein [Adlercreutzia murintestinalis]
MKAAIPYFLYNIYQSVGYAWDDDCYLSIDMANDRCLICANAEGFLFLAITCVSFAHPIMKDWDDISYSDFFPCQERTRGALIIMRRKEVDDNGCFFVDDRVLSAFGGEAAYNEIYELALDVTAAATTEKHEAEQPQDVPYYPPARTAFVEYLPCDAQGNFKDDFDLHGHLKLEVTAKESAYLIGDDLGLLSLASIFVSMAQPNMPEEGMLILDADAFAPGSYGHLELMRIDTWPQWNLTRSDAIPEAFRQDKD